MATTPNRDPDLDLPQTKNPKNGQLFSHVHVWIKENKTRWTKVNDDIFKNETWLTKNVPWDKRYETSEEFMQAVLDSDFYPEIWRDIVLKYVTERELL